MGTNLITPPTLLPVEVCEQKDHCGVDGTDQDNLIQSCIKDATDYVQRASGRQLMTATYRKSLDEFPDEIILDHPPLQSITTITYTDTDGESQTLDASDYQVDTHSIKGKVVPAYGTTFPNTRAIPNAVQVTYVCGYTSRSNVPDAAKRAIRFLAAHYFENREAVVTGTITSTIPLAVDSLIASISIPEVI